MKLSLRILLTLALSLSVFFSLPITVQAQNDQVEIPNVTPLYIKRYTYMNEEVIGGAKKTGAKGSTAGSSGLSTSTLLTSIGGVLSVLGGSVFTWIKLRGKNKVFKEFLANIDKTYQEMISNKSVSEGKNGIKKIREALIKIQESAELAAANKKIDEGQFIAITSHIKRKIEGT